MFLAGWGFGHATLNGKPLYDNYEMHPTYLNYAVWESTAAFRDAFGHPEFRTRLSAYLPSAVASPHLFQKIAAPGICVA